MTYRVTDEETACDEGCCLVGVDDEIRPRHESWRGLAGRPVDDETPRPMFEVLTDDVWDAGDEAVIQPTTEAGRARYLAAIDEALFAIVRAGPDEISAARRQFYLVWYDRECILRKDSRED